jgi:hypothetical protein
VVFRATDPALSMTTSLAVAQDATTGAIAPLLRACAVAGRQWVQPVA